MASRVQGCLPTFLLVIGLVALRLPTQGATQLVIGSRANDACI